MPGPATRVVTSVSVSVALLVLGSALPVSADAPGPVTYRPPVDAPVAERFRPPAQPYGPGKLGIGYATAPGTPVRTAAPGEVAFAGNVGGGLHVVVLHADGIRTSYSFLASIAVRRNQRVEVGAVLGTTGPSLHFGARAAGDAYLDPMELLGGGAMRLRLVPDGSRRPDDVARERRGLRRMLAALPRVASRVGEGALGWARKGAGTVAHAVADLPPLEDLLTLASDFGLLPAGIPIAFHMAVAAKDWWDRRDDCTSSGLAPPSPPRGPRLLVLVAGLGSDSNNAGIAKIKTADLGYADADVVRFSYRGGTTAERAYGSADSQGDLAESARRLRALLEREQAARPGVRIDVIAHSQGGLVARAALGRRPPPAVRNLVTLASPHQGADLATLASMAPLTPQLAVLQAVARPLLASWIDTRSTAVEQLAEGSGFIRRLNSSPPPVGVRVTSIAARADPVVAAPRARLPGAANVVVAVPGLNDHGNLPESAAANREIALALAGMAPTCESLFDALADAAVGRAIATAEEAAIAAVVRGPPVRAGGQAGRSGGTTDPAASLRIRNAPKATPPPRTTPR